jgi:hypothetical protein
MDQQAVDAITALQNRNSVSAERLMAVFELLIGIMLENGQITKAQYNKVKKLLVSL